MSSLAKLKPIHFIILSVSVLIIVSASIRYNNSSEEEPVSVDTDEKSGISIFHTEKPQKGLLIYIGDNTSSNKISRRFAQLSYYVAQISPQSLLSLGNGQQCVNVAEKLTSMASELQKKYAIAAEDLPILVGNNDGAAVVYTALAQADRKSFHAGISINFNTQLNSSAPLCAIHSFAGNGGESHTEIFPVKHLPASWYVFQNGKVAKDPEALQFLAHISNAKLTASDKTASDSIDEAMQILQWLDPRLADQISSDNSDTDLPVIEVPAEGDQQTLAVLLTGDGGWAEIDKSLAKLLAEKAIPTVAVDSLSYFWRARTPQETAKDVDDLISLYSEKWHKKNVILIGYSFGADVLPFVANRLSDSNKQKVGLVALLGMGKTAAFEFRLSSWMNADTSEHRLPLTPEIENMRWANSICIYGVEDKETNCTTTGEQGVKVISMKGDHHFDEDYDLLVQHILDNVKIPERVESTVTTEKAEAVTPEITAPTQPEIQ